MSSEGPFCDRQHKRGDGVKSAVWPRQAFGGKLSVGWVRPRLKPGDDVGNSK